MSKPSGALSLLRQGLRAMGRQQLNADVLAPVVAVDANFPNQQQRSWSNTSKRATAVVEYMVEMDRDAQIRAGVEGKKAVFESLITNVTNDESLESLDRLLIDNNQYIVHINEQHPLGDIVALELV